MWNSSWSNTVNAATPEADTEWAGATVRSGSAPRRPSRKRTVTSSASPSAIAPASTISSLEMPVHSWATSDPPVPDGTLAIRRSQ
jgi:hypothetical protein